MKTKKDLVIGFSDDERKRTTANLERLLPHLKPDQFVIVGGLAIRYHLITHGISYPRRPFNDLDIIVKNKKVVSLAVAKDFLIYHYHPKDYFLALVDPKSKTKVDIFSYYPVPHRTIKAKFGMREVDIVSIEDQLVKTVFDIQRISEKAKVDPKQFLDTRLLMEIADMELVDRLWRANNFKKWPKTIQKAIDRAEKIAKNDPEWLQEKPFVRVKPFVCPQCQSIKDFRIVPMDEIYKILGYVE